MTNRSECWRRLYLALARAFLAGGDKLFKVLVRANAGRVLLELTASRRVHAHGTKKLGLAALLGRMRVPVDERQRRATLLERAGCSHPHTAILAVRARR